ncbi:MAG: hypothetical protein HDR14_14140 [Lachnospiraceae bacterium]|nr:hypothetical protein [Lachnospiraceae bacterium]
MREQRVILEPFELLDILQCTGMVAANTHGYMAIKGHIGKEKEEGYLKLLSGDVWATVKLCDEDGKVSTLYTGIVTESEIEVDNGLKTLEIVIKTGSFLMDIKKHIRSFQKKSYPYREMLKSFADSYQNYEFIMQKGREESANTFLCQYKETDWEFAKRIAMLCSTVLYPNYIGSGEKYYFGMPVGQNRGKIDLTEYVLKQTQKGVIFEGIIRDVFDIGDIVNFLGKDLYVISRKTEYKQNELYHTYEFSEEEKGTNESIYNDNIIGVSLDATVTGVSGTDVTISISADENKMFSGSRRFPYATIYSSPDGSGWYCMPEEGDNVRLYFPSNEENEAYVACSLHMTSEDNNQRVNPNHKSIMNKQGKEILLKPDSILITNNNGMSLELSDNKGISIISDKKIRFESKEAIEITSTNENVDLVSSQKISLEQGSTAMTLSDNLVVRGTKVRLD